MTDSITVAYVHSTDVSHSWAKSMLRLTEHSIQHGWHGGRIASRYGSGGIVQARNGAVDGFLVGDTDWLFWIDTDMGFAPDTVTRLAEHATLDRPVVGGLCFMNHETGDDGMAGYQTVPVPSVYRWVRQPDGRTGFTPDLDYPRDSLYQCEGTGSACILIHRSVFETIGDRWYTPLVNPNTGEPFGEDLSFCLRLAEHDIPLHVHTGVKTTHHKPVWLGEAHFDEWRRADKAVTPNRAERRRNERKKGRD